MKGESFTLDAIKVQKFEEHDLEYVHVSCCTVYCYSIHGMEQERSENEAV
jgi:hypothetical protein